MSSMDRFFNMTKDDLIDARKEALTKKIKDYIIDTCYCFDTEKWETGICKDDEWTIVEVYENKKEAIKGHKKWCDYINNTGKIELKNVVDIIDWGLG